MGKKGYRGAFRPRLGWRNPWWRRSLLVMGWAVLLVGVAAGFVIDDVVAQMVDLPGPLVAAGAALLALGVWVTLPEPLPRDSGRELPRSPRFIAQRANLLAATSVPTSPTVLDAYRSHRPVVVPRLTRSAA